MIKIAITGKIGTGKTTVSNIIRNLGYQVFESDVEIKKVYKESIVIEKLKKEFKDKIPNLFYKNGLVNKRNLGKYVFSKINELKKLERIVYPELNKKKEKFIISNNKEKLTFFDIPLLFEKKLHKNYEQIIYTDVDKNEQEKRVLKRRDIDSKKFKNILKVQSHSYVKIKKYVSLYLNTSFAKPYLHKTIKAFLKEIEKS